MPGRVRVPGRDQDRWTWHTPLSFPIFPLEWQAHPLWLLVAWFWQMLHLPLPTTALAPNTDSESTKSLSLTQDSRSPRIQCALSTLLPFPHIGKPCPCPGNPYRTSTSGLCFFPGDRKKQNPQPRTNSDGKTLNGDWEHLRCEKLAKGMGIEDPRNWLPAVNTHTHTQTHLCFFFFFSYFYILGPLHAACRILVPRPGMDPGTTALKAPSPNYWTAKEFPIRAF